MSSLSFQNPISRIAFAKPKTLRLGMASYETPIWSKVLEMAARAMLENIHYREAALAAIKRFSWMAHSSRGMARPCELEKNLWIELHQGSHGILIRTKMLLEACGYPLDQASLECSDSTDKSAKSGKDAASAPPPSAVVTPSKLPMSPATPATNVPSAHPQSKVKPTSKTTLAEPVQPTLFGPSPGSEKIGAYAKRMLYHALGEKGCIPEEDFKTLLTNEGTKRLLGLSLTTCPLFSFTPMVRRDGRRGSWNDPALHNGKPIYVNSQWYEEHRTKLDKLLLRWQTDFQGKSVTTDIETNLSILLQAGFSNGFRPGSIIDRNKFRRLYAQKFGTELPPNFDFDSVLPSLGVVHDGKVFPVACSSDQSPESFVKSLEERSHGIFFFGALFDAEADTFTSMGVLSGEMLRTILKKAVPDTYVYGRSFFTLPSSPHAVADAIESAFKVKGEWSREELETFFPYVPADMLVSVLAQDDRFVRVAEGTYRLLSGILLDEAECRQAALTAIDEVTRVGFFSLASTSFQRSLERNGDISPSAVQTAFFERFLSDRFDRHGKVVCAKGASFDSRMAVRAFCRDSDEVTMEELLRMEREFDLGGGNRSIVTAHEEMVRVSEERFVAPRLVSFDVAAVDAALDSLVPPSGVLPLVSVRSFVSFPPLSGWEWNVYLLEGFLRRASASFAFLSVSAAPRTACGAIVRRSAGFPTIIDALARAVVEAGVSANEKEVGNYLIAQGYIQRRRGVEKDVAEMAQRSRNSLSGKQQGAIP